MVAKKYAWDEIGLSTGFYTSFDWGFTKKYVFVGKEIGTSSNFSFCIGKENRNAKFFIFQVAMRTAISVIKAVHHVTFFLLL